MKKTFSFITRNNEQVNPCSSDEYKLLEDIQALKTPLIKECAFNLCKAFPKLNVGKALSLLKVATVDELLAFYEAIVDEGDENEIDN